jgi:hypothetical protein
MNASNTQYDILLQNLLADHADGLLKGVVSTTALLTRYGLTGDLYIKNLIHIAEQIQIAMPEVEPSEAFVAALYAQLVGAHDHNMFDRLVAWRIERLRHLPAHMQLAAGLGGLTLTAGLYWIMRGRGVNFQSVVKAAGDLLPTLSSSERSA